ncbi:MAG: hypothetical protein ABIR71_00500 [Chthoniobacterales bacterium]
MDVLGKCGLHAAQAAEAFQFGAFFFLAGHNLHDLAVGGVFN